MIPGIVYTLCAVTALLCAVLLLRAYLRVRSRVLLWSALCFVGLMLSNAVLVLDKLVYTEMDLHPVRLYVTLISLLLLLFGLLYSND